LLEHHVPVLSPRHHSHAVQNAEKPRHISRIMDGWMDGWME
jgi:hypothetical protein